MAGAHGSPLGDEEIRLTKEAMGWPSQEPFFVPEEALHHFRRCVERGAELQAEWEQRFDAYREAHPELAQELGRPGEPAGHGPAGQHGPGVGEAAQQPRRLLAALPPVARWLVGAWLLKTTLSVQALWEAAERVRLALAAGDQTAARAGLSVLGVEANETRAKQLRAGTNPIPDVLLAEGDVFTHLMTCDCGDKRHGSITPCDRSGGMMAARCSWRRSMSARSTPAFQRLPSLAHRVIIRSAS